METGITAQRGSWRCSAGVVSDGVHSTDTASCVIDGIPGLQWDDRARGTPYAGRSAVGPLRLYQTTCVGSLSLNVDYAGPISPGWSHREPATRFAQVWGATIDLGA
jgi:hypothetical protein